MAEQVSKSKRPEGQSCVAGAPNNKSYTNNGKQHTEGISLHGFPKDPTVNGKKKQQNSGSISSVDIEKNGSPQSQYTMSLYATALRYLQQ